jgi:hypothetical protein
MNRQAREDQIKSRLLAFGYKPVGMINPTGTMKLRFLPTGKIEFLRMRQVEYRVKMGYLKPVDPDLGTITPPRGGQQDWFRGIPNWDQESDVVKGLALQYHLVIQAKVERRENVSRSWNELSMDQNRATAYAFIACLRRFKFDQYHRSLFVVTRNDVPEYKFINEDTVYAMENMMNSVWSDDEFESLSKADDPSNLYFLGEKWDSLAFEFIPVLIQNPLDIPDWVGDPEEVNRRRAQVRARRRGQAGRGVGGVAVGFFPWINCGDDDMTKFGIFNEFDPENYKNNCVVQTFAKFLTKGEVTFLKSIIRTSKMPVKCLKEVADLFWLTIYVHLPSGKTMPKIEGSDENKGKRKKKRVVDVFILGEHLMIFEDGLRNRLRKLDLRPMTVEEINVAARVRSKEELSVVGYPEEAKRVWQVEENRKPFVLLDWLGTVDKNAETREEGFWIFRKLMMDKFGLDPTKFDTLTKLAFSLLHSRCSNIVELRGSVAQYIRECRKKAILGTPNQEYPLVVDLGSEEELVQLDQSGSYPAAYRDFGGIPRGLPSMIKDWEEVKKSGNHYYVRVDVVSFKCKHPEDPYPLVEGTGVQSWDKFWLEAVEKHYDVEYRFVDGYYFRHGFQEIASLTNELWSLRVRGSPEEMFVKRVMNVLWGRSLRRGKLVDDLFEKKFDSKRSLVYSVRQVKQGENAGKYRVRVLRPIVAPWQIPQFGVNVLNFARCRMTEIIYRIVDAGEKVWYTCTDSLLVRKEVSALVPCGKELGEFKVEYEVKKFIALGKLKRALLLRQGGFVNVRGRKDWEWFEKEAEVKKESRKEVRK